VVAAGLSRPRLPPAGAPDLGCRHRPGGGGDGRLEGLEYCVTCKGARSAT
jgi:hypothetical protein